ncbi:MAG: hypothetical protein AAGA93_13105 [Actinomycetota bacterium]
MATAVLAGVAAVLVAVALINEVLLARPAGAEVFAITVLDSEVRLDVIEVVTDPTRVEAQLRDELGLDSSLVAVPAAPELVGTIVAAGSGGSIAPELRVVAADDGTIERIVLPEGFNDGLLIEFGRTARPGETYVATTTAAICADLWGMGPTEASGALTARATTIRYELIDADNNVTTNAAADQVPRSYHLIDVTPLAADELVVTYAADIDARPRHPNCR